MNPRWFQLLHYCHKREDGRRYYGVTFPFILGAMRCPVGEVISPDDARLEFSNLLESMLDDIPDGFVLRISRCDHLKQPVITPNDARYKLQGQAMHSYKQSRDTIFVENGLLSKSDSSLNSLGNQLWNEFGDAVCSGKFSFLSGKYCGFSQDDLFAIGQSWKHESYEC